MDEVINILMGKDFPVLATFLMGLVVCVSPCTLAANISALSYMSKAGTTEEIRAGRLFFRSVAYTIGRTVAYALLGITLLYFTGGTEFGAKIQYWVGVMVGPLFILVGLLMLDVIHIHGFADKCVARFNLSEKKFSVRRAFFVGFLLAFAFCPYCASVYFGLMMPLSLSQSLPMAVLLPVSFAVGAALPVLVLSWVLAYSAQSLSQWYGKFSKFELWFRRGLGVLFLVSGLLFVTEYFFE
ncbi:MAG: sulfite exporter TauE/SafE family protein [Paludibacteraceae bacterium]|nr:sulfite exporter TauE/SafE family protein [Paludibacteraceae bacterium]